MVKTRKHQAGKVKALCLALSLGLASTAALAETYTLNFKDAEIKELVKFVADTTGHTVIVDPKVKGNIQLISSKPVTKKELYDLFLSVLAMNGFAAIKNGNVIRVVPDNTARTRSVPVVTGTPNANAEFITQVIELQNISATQLIPVLRPRVPQAGHMAAYGDTNTIIISDTADNIKKVMEIIKVMDKTSHQEFEVIKLQYSSAEETVRILSQILKAGAAAGGKETNTEEDQLTMVADKRSNSIIVSGTQVARMRLKLLVSEMDTALESSGNAQVVFLRYASAKDLGPVLARVSQNMNKSGADPQAAGKGALQPAAIEADEATNSLIITAQSDVMEGLRAVIERLDIPRAQVLVEAIIVEVRQDDGKALGFDWLAANKSGGFGGSNMSDGLAGSVAVGAFDEDEEDALKGIAAALAGVPGAMWGGAEYNLGGTSFSAILTALETNGEANILSTPSLMTLDNNQATIVVGQEVPFVTGSYTSTGTSGATTNVGNPFQTITRENVGITLTVTPHVNKGDQITMKILQEVSGLSGSTSELSTADVVTNERRIETTVSAKDGEVIVLGGLIRDEVQETVSKVPILGDIPLIGRLFKSSSTSVGKTNLMVFLKPTVIRSSEKSLEVTKDSYNEIRDVQRIKRLRGVDLFDESAIPVLPSWKVQQPEKQPETAVAEPVVEQPVEQKVEQNVEPKAEPKAEPAPEPVAPVVGAPVVEPVAPVVEPAQ